MSQTRLIEMKLRGKLYAAERRDVESLETSFHINDSASNLMRCCNNESRQKNSLRNVFNHIGLERKFKLEVVALDEAVALGVYQRLVAC